MMKYLSCVFFASAFCINGQADPISQDVQTYLEKREEALLLNKAFSMDGKLVLSAKEKQIDAYLKKLKKNQLSFSKDFRLENSFSKENDLYAFIEKMPKGGMLHVHSASLLASEWLIQELTTLPDCYVYWKEDGPVAKGTLHFYEKTAVPEGFLLVEHLRSTLTGFDEILLSLLQMEKIERTSSGLWEKFEGWFSKTRGLIHYKPAFLKYYELSMKSLVEDNLQYMELRALNTPIYHLDGTVEDRKGVIDAFLQIKKEVQKKYPHFDFKIIHTEFRNSPKDKSLGQLELAYYLRSLYPNFIIGYDLVGEEDTGRTTLDHIESLMASKSFEKKYGVDLPYYFHNGESNSAYNTNLYESVLLKSKRIGHGLNLFNFPYLMEKIKEENICLEICPISNQILGYVSDLRSHPASGYLKAGIPCVISSDDPGLFGYHGLSPDLWVAVLAWDLDLLDIKQLCMNSLQYSGMSFEEKKVAFQFWNEKWNAFIDLMGEI